MKNQKKHSNSNKKDSDIIDIKGNPPLFVISAAAITHLSPTGTPGRRYSFAAQEEDYSSGTNFWMGIT